MIFGFSIIAIIWQWNDNLALFDLNYFVEISNNISLSKTPFKDFILVVAPLTYLIQGIIFKIFGTNYIFILIPSIALNFSCAYLLYKNLTKNNFSKINVNLITVMFLFGSGISLFPWLHYDNFIFFLIALYYNELINNKKNNIFFEFCLTILILFTKQNVGLVFLILIYIYDFIFSKNKVFLRKIFLLIIFFSVFFFFLKLTSIDVKIIINQLFVIPFEFRIEGDTLLNYNKLFPEIFSEKNFPRFIACLIMSLIVFITYFNEKIQTNKFIIYPLMFLSSYIFIAYCHYGFVWYFLLAINLICLIKDYPKFNSNIFFIVIIILTCISGYNSGGVTGSSFGTILLMIFITNHLLKISKINVIKNKKVRIYIIYSILMSTIFHHFFNQKMSFGNSSNLSKIELLFTGIDTTYQYNYNLNKLINSKELINFSNESVINIPGEDAIFTYSKFNNPLNYNQLYPQTTGLSNKEILKDVFSKYPKLLFIKISEKNRYKILQSFQLENVELNKKGYYLILEEYGYQVYERK